MNRSVNNNNKLTNFVSNSSKDSLEQSKSSNFSEIDILKKLGALKTMSKENLNDISKFKFDQALSDSCSIDFPSELSDEIVTKMQEIHIALLESRFLENSSSRGEIAEFLRKTEGLISKNCFYDQTDGKPLKDCFERYFFNSSHSSKRKLFLSFLMNGPRLEFLIGSTSKKFVYDDLTFVSKQAFDTALVAFLKDEALVSETRTQNGSLSTFFSNDAIRKCLISGLQQERDLNHTVTVLHQLAGILDSKALLDFLDDKAVQQVLLPIVENRKTLEKQYLSSSSLITLCELAEKLERQIKDKMDHPALKICVSGLMHCVRFETVTKLSDNTTVAPEKKNALFSILLRMNSAAVFLKARIEELKQSSVKEGSTGLNAPSSKEKWEPVILGFLNCNAPKALSESNMTVLLHTLLGEDHGKAGAKILVEHADEALLKKSILSYFSSLDNDQLLSALKQFPIEKDLEMGPGKTVLKFCLEDNALKTKIISLLLDKTPADAYNVIRLYSKTKANFAPIKQEIGEDMGVLQMKIRAEKEKNGNAFMEKFFDLSSEFKKQSIDAGDSRSQQRRMLSYVTGIRDAFELSFSKKNMDSKLTNKIGFNSFYTKLVDGLHGEWKRCLYEGLLLVSVDDISKEGVFYKQEMEAKLRDCDILSWSIGNQKLTYNELARHSKKFLGSGSFGSVLSFLSKKGEVAVKWIENPSDESEKRFDALFDAEQSLLCKVNSYENQIGTHYFPILYGHSRTKETYWLSGPRLYGALVMECVSGKPQSEVLDNWVDSCFKEPTNEDLSNIKVEEFFDDDEVVFSDIENEKQNNEGVSQKVSSLYFSGWSKKGLTIRMHQILKQMVCLLDALMVLQKNGIYHRDIKPDNLMVDKNGDVVVIDFGLATTQVTKGHIAGTLDYMSPEACQGNFCEKSDLYSAGKIFFELLVLPDYNLFDVSNNATIDACSFRMNEFMLDQLEPLDRWAKFHNDKVIQSCVALIQDMIAVRKTLLDKKVKADPSNRIDLETALKRCQEIAKLVGVEKKEWTSPGKQNVL